MKKKLAIILLAILIVAPTIENVTATTVFLTSDNIIDENTDLDILNSIKHYIEEISEGKITVVVDESAPGPGEGTRAIESESDVSVNLAASCAGNFLVLSKYSETSNKQIIFVNSGDFDLDSENYIRRAWDDDYSSTNFAGINLPGKFLNSSGISYVQPLQKYPDAGSDGVLSKDDGNVNKYIAESIVEEISNYDNNSKSLNNDLIVKHELSPSEMAKASSQYLKDDSQNSFNGYSASQLLYLTSGYLNGNGLKNPSDYGEPSSPLKYSLFARSSYSIYDYMKMGGMVRNYMDEHGQAPDYINYDGAYISYYDLEYNFAKITESHVDSNHMNFNREYDFYKVNQSILVDLFPFIAVIMIILATTIIIIKIK